MIFDVSRQLPQNWWMIAIPLVMVVVGLGVFRKKSTPVYKVFLVFFLGFAVLMALVQSVLIGKEYAELRSALARGDFNRIEGVVTDFTPENPAIDRPERFGVITTAGRHEYSISRSIVAQGFTGGPPYDGLLQEGVLVRIADVDGKIARLEVAEAPKANSAP
jgi:hypothetical protein